MFLFDWMYSALASLGMSPQSDEKMTRKKRKVTREMTRKTLRMTMMPGSLRFGELLEEWDQTLFQQR